MTEQQNSTAIVTPVSPAAPSNLNILSAQVGVDKTDVIDIALVRQEELLEKAKRENGQQTRLLQEEIKEDETKLQELCLTQAKDMDTAPDQAVAIALKQNGYGAFVVSTELQAVDEARQNIRVKVKVEAKQTKKGAYRNDSLDREEVQPFSPEAKGQLKTLRGKREHLTHLTRQASDIHRALSNMNALARKLKAKLAEHRLAQSDEGLAILQQLADVGTASLPRFLLEAQSA